MSRDAAILGSARRLGWADPRDRGAQVALISAAVAVVVEAGHFFARWPESIIVGGIPVAPSIVFIALAAIAGGSRAFGRPRTPDAGLVFWVLIVVGLAAAMTLIAGGRANARAVLGVTLVGFGEEFMYRGAIPAVAAFSLARAGMAPRRAGLAGLVIGGALFVVLPGHVAQWESVADALPFAAFALIAALAVWRTGALFEVAMLHVVVNLVNIGRLGGVNDPMAGVLLAGLTLLLVVAYVPPAADRGDDLVIDLTDPDAPVVSSAEPTVRSAARLASVEDAGLDRTDG